MKTYKAFCEVVACGLRFGSWTAAELWGDVPMGEKVLGMIDTLGAKKYEQFVSRMRAEGKLTV